MFLCFMSDLNSKPAKKMESLLKHLPDTLSRNEFYIVMQLFFYI